MFRDRRDAGQQLAARLSAYAGKPVVVLGLPRGGVPVALEVARALHAPLDVIVVRKLGAPSNPELGFGAISEEDVVVFNHDVIRSVGVWQGDIDHAIAVEKRELQRRLGGIRSKYPEQSLKDKIAIIVDDGIATGIDAKAACRVARARGAKLVVLAVPVAAADWKASMQRDADVLIAVDEDPLFMAVGAYYADFTQVADAEVLQCLESACLTP